MGSRVVTAKRWLSDRWGWVISAASSVLFFMNFGFILVFSIVFVALQEEFGSTATQTAWVGSIPLGLASVCSPLANLLIERFRHRTVVVGGVIISTVGIIATSFMPTLAPMYFTFSLAFGFGTSMVMFTSFKLILAYFPVENSVRATVMPMMSSNIGMFTLGPLTYLLQTRYGWRNMLRIMGSLVGLISVPLCLVLKPPPKLEDIPQSAAEAHSSRKYCEIVCAIDDEEDQSLTKEQSKSDFTSLGDDGKPGKEAGMSGESKRGCELEKHFGEELNIEKESSRSLIWRVIGTLTYPDVALFSISAFGYGLVNTFVIIQMGNVLLSIGHTEESVSLVVIAIGVSLVVGKIGLFFFADLAPFPKLGFFLIASVMGIIVLTSLLFLHNLVIILTLTSILGVTVMSTADCLPYSVCNHLFGVAIGTQAMPIVSFFLGSGGIFASLLGESVDKTGSYDLSIYACIGAYALCGLFCLFVPVYQQCFVKDRFIMDIQFGWKKRESRIMEEVKSARTSEEVTYAITDNRISTVAGELV